MNGKGVCTAVPEVEEEGGVRVDCLSMRPWVALCRGEGLKEKLLVRAGRLAGWVSPSLLLALLLPCCCSSSGTWLSADRCVGWESMGYLLPYTLLHSNYQYGCLC